MLWLRSFRQLWSPPPPVPPRSRHDQIIGLVIAAAGADPFRPVEVYRRLLSRADFALPHREFDTHLWAEAQRPAARLERLGHGRYRAR